MCSASATELVEVVKYYRDCFDDTWKTITELSTEIGTEMTSKGLEVLSLPGKILRGKDSKPDRAA